MFPSKPQLRLDFTTSSYDVPPFSHVFRHVLRRFSTFRATGALTRSRLHDVDATSGMARHQKAIAQSDVCEAEHRTVHQRQT